MAQVDKSFDKAYDGWDKRPAEKQVKNSTAGFVQVEFVHSQAAQEDRQKDRDAAAPSGDRRAIVEMAPLILSGPHRVAAQRAGPGAIRYGLSAFGTSYERHFLTL